MIESSPLSVSVIFKEAFKQTKGNFIVFLPILILLFLAINLFFTKYLTDIDFSSPEALNQFQGHTYLITIVTLLATPIEVGLMLMGVRASRGFKIKTTNILAIFSDSARIVILGLFAFVAVQIGMTLLILPGIFILMMTSMAQPLMCDFRLTMIEAVKRSWMTCYKELPFIISFYLALFAIIVASFFTYGLALIFTIPFYMNAKGILYCQLYDEPTQNDSDILAS